MKRRVSWLLAALLAVLALAVPSREPMAQGALANLPRNETLIVENPEGTIKNAGWFNIWAINAGGQSTGLQQLGDGHVLVHRPADAASTASGRTRWPPRSRSTTPTSPR